MSAPLPRYRTLFIAGTIFLIAMLAPFATAVNSVFWDTLMDASHVPIFAWLTWLLYKTNPLGFAGRTANYRFSVVAALLSAAGVEILQAFTGRSASFDDLVKGAMGIGSVALFLGGWRMTGIAAGLISLAIVLVPPARAARGMIWRVAHFPLLGDFETSTELALWLQQERDGLLSPTERRRVRSHATHGEYALQVPIRRSQWPGVRLLCADQDWMRFSTFAFDVVNDQQPFRLSVRIDDSQSSDNTNRFNTAFEILRGVNHVRIPLVQMASMPSARPLNLHSIRRILFFEPWSELEHTYYLDYVRLE